MLTGGTSQELGPQRYKLAAVSSPVTVKWRVPSPFATALLYEMMLLAFLVLQTYRGKRPFHALISCFQNFNCLPVDENSPSTTQPHRESARFRRNEHYEPLQSSNFHTMYSFAV